MAMKAKLRDATTPSLNGPEQTFWIESSRHNRQTDRHRGKNIAVGIGGPAESLYQLQDQILGLFHPMYKRDAGFSDL